MLAYHALEKAKEEHASNSGLLQNDQGNLIHLPEMSCQLIERLVKRRRSHCNIADQEKSFLNYANLLMKRTSAKI